MNARGHSAQPAQEDYSRLFGIGLALAVVTILILSFYWFTDGSRLTAAAAELSAGRVARGEETFTSQCAACHGTLGEGGVGPALNNRAVLKNTPDQIFFSVIRSGVPNTQMPSWSIDFGGPLTDEEIHDVVAFLRAWEPTAPEILAHARQPDAPQGALLFSSTCSICHGENGTGGKPGIPAVNDQARLNQFSDDWYRAVISNGRPAKGMPTWGTVLSPAQIDDLVALLAAWRAGKTVAPAYSVPNLLDLALSALDQEDEASARLHVSRALGITTGSPAAELRRADELIEGGSLVEAQTVLTELKAVWPPGDSQAGEAVYAVECAACHGPQGEGGVGKPLQGSAFVQAQSNSDLLKFIQAGRPGTAMAGFGGRLTETQIADVIAWLRTWQPSAPQ